MNADLIALGKNYADSSLNLRFARSVGVENEYRAASEEIQNEKYNFVLINNSQSCPSPSKDKLTKRHKRMGKMINWIWIQKERKRKKKIRGGGG